MNKPNCNRCGNQMGRIGDAPWFCVLCPDEPPAPTYTDDVIAVMRDTISAQRETIAAKDALIADLRAGIHSATRTIAACPSCSRQMLRGELA